MEQHIWKRRKTNCDVASTLFSCKTTKCQKNEMKKTFRTKINNNRSELKCMHCHKTWIVCIPCHKRFHISKISIADKHFEEMHNTNENNQMPTLREQNLEQSFYNDDEAQLITGTTRQASEQWASETTLNEVSKIYFKDRNESVEKALHQIVGKAFSQSHEIVQEPSNEESGFHLRLTNFLTHISTTQQHDLIQLLNDAKNIQMTTTRLPLHTNDIAKFYTKNKYAIYNQLPSPTCKVNEYHTYVDLESIVEHYVAFGYDTEDSNVAMNDIATVGSTVLQCKEAISHINTIIGANTYNTQIQPIILFLMIWSDGFEANNNQRNKHSTWLRTVTICADEKFGISTQHTYLIALGYKQENHDDANMILKNTINKMSKKKLMYSGKRKQYVDVYTKVLIMSADRPERSELLHILGHTGTTTRRWRFSAYINQEKLPSCKICLTTRLDDIQKKNDDVSTDGCRHCCNWNYNSRCRHIQYEKPKLYPKTKHPTSPQAPRERDVNNLTYLEPVEQTIEWLKMGCRFCFHNVFYSTWNLGVAKEYMRSLGVTHAFSRKYVISTAKQLLAEQPNHPDPSSTLKFPPLWEINIKMDQYIDVPMHLLFLGITKAIIEFTFQWITLHERLSSFGQYVHPLHRNIQQIQSEFCRLESFTCSGSTSTSGWKSENYLAFCRCINYSFGYISQFISNDYKREKDAFEHVHHLLLCMMARLMTNIPVTLTEIDQHIKAFLSMFDICEKVTFVESTNDMIWYSKSNFLCLLNLREQIHKYGPMRNYWEGSRERYIHEIKQYMERTRDTTSFLKTQLEKLMKTNTISNLCRETELITKKVSYERYNSFVSYKNIEMAVNIIQYGKPISALYKEEELLDMVYIPIRDKRKINLHKVNFEDDQGTYEYNSHYASINIETEPTKSFESVKNVDIQTYCPALCLPRFIQSSKYVYMVLASNWLYRSSDGKFKLPTIPRTTKEFVQNIM